MRNLNSIKVKLTEILKFEMAVLIDVYTRLASETSLRKSLTLKPDKEVLRSFFNAFISLLRKASV